MSQMNPKEVFHNTAYTQFYYIWNIYNSIRINKIQLDFLVCPYYFGDNVFNIYLEI